MQDNQQFLNNPVLPTSTSNEFSTTDISLPEYKAPENFALKEIQKQVDSIKNDIKSKTSNLDNPISLNITDRMGLRNSKSFSGGWDNDKIKFTEYDVNPNEVFTQLNSGKYVTKFNNYIAHTDNEERLANNQSSFSQVVNGLGKFVGKTGLNILDGTVGSVNGLIQGIKDGQGSSVYNNNFSKWIDDVNKQMDYKLPNYYTQEQRNKNFLQSMGTVNFWANDVTQGLSFMTGMLGSEAIWAVATGGSSLATLGARASLKAASKGLLKKGSKEFVKDSKSIYKSYLRTVPKSSIGRNFNNLRFLYTSAGFEAGVEARHSLNESVENYMRSYENVYHRKPSTGEMREFMNHAVNASNGVYAANVALVGSSNILMFGGLFDISTKLRTSVGRKFGRAFGQGLVREHKNGSTVIKALKANKIKTVAGNAYNILKTPFREGFIEEGGQGVITRTSQNWLASQFNADAAKQNMSVMESAYNAFYETYGTKEGFKEVGLGIIIGGFGGMTSTSRGKWTPLGVGEFSATQEFNEELADTLNKNINNFNESQLQLIDRLISTNTLNNFVSSAKEKVKNEDYTGATRDWDSASFTKMMMEDSADLLNDSVADFNYLIDNVNESVLQSEYGLEKEDIDSLKTALKSEYNRNHKLYKQSKKIAESVNLNFKEGKTRKKSYTNELAYNIYMGAKSSDRIGELSDRLEEMVGVGGLADAMSMYNNLAQEEKDKVTRMSQLQVEIQELELAYSNAVNSFEATKNKKDSVESNTNTANSANRISTDIEAKRAKLVKSRNELEQLKQDLIGRNYITENDYYIPNLTYNPIASEAEFESSNVNYTVTNESLDSMVNALDRLDGYLKTLSKQNPEAYNSVVASIQEFNFAVRDFRDFNIAFRQLTDPRLSKEYQGVLNLFKNSGNAMPDELLNNSQFDLATEQLEAKLNNSDLSEEDKFKIKLLHRLDTAFRVGKDLGVIERQSLETISNEEYEQFKNTNEVSLEIQNRIVDKVLSADKGNRLSKRESDIYNKKKEFFKELLYTRKYEVGDDVITESVNVTRDETKLVDKLKQKVDFITKKTKYLEDFNIDEFEKADKPTAIELALYRKYKEKINDGKVLSPKVQTIFQQLRDKINKWGRFQGTILEDGQNLSDIIDQIIVLENTKPLEESNSVINIEPVEIYNTIEFASNRKGNNFDFIQSFEKALVSRDEDGIYHIHNTSINEILNIINKVDGIKVTKNKVAVKSTDKGFKTEPKVDDIYRIQKGEDYITLRIGKGNNVLLSDKAKSFLNTNTTLRIFPTDNLPTNYQPLFKEVIDEDGNKLTSVDSDFVFFNTEVVDNDAVSSLKEGDDLFFEVDLRDKFNRKLVSEFNKNNTSEITPDNYGKVLKTGMTVENSKGQRFTLTDKIPYKKSIGKVAFGLSPIDKTLKPLPLEYEAWNRNGFEVVGVAKDNEVIKKLQESLVIKVRDKNNKLIGVLKAVDNLGKATKDINREAITRVRRLAAKRVIETGFEDTNIIDLDIQSKVKQVYSGHPNISYRKEDGKYKIVFNKFNDSNLGKVKDIGYMEGKKVFLKNKVEGVNKYPYLTNLERNSFYSEKRIPIVVFEHQGKLITYPLTLVKKEVDYTSRFEQILDSNETQSDKIVTINKLIIESGLDVNSIGLTSELITEERLELIAQQLGTVGAFSDVTTWLNNANDLETILKEDAVINIDINDKPFHSPKVKLDISNTIDKLSEKPIIEPTEFGKKADDKLEKKVSKIIEKTC